MDPTVSSCTMLTEPWIVDPVSIAPRINTLPQPVESKSKARVKIAERRCVTNHPATELYPWSRAARSQEDKGRARPEMIWKHRTPEQWTRIVVARLR